MGDDDDGPACRICFEHGGELFAPCACTGSMRYVHRSCLDEWRVRSANPHSFARCDQCHASYRCRSHPMAHWLERPEVVYGAATLVLAACTCVCAVALWPLAPHRAFYELVRWRPPDEAPAWTDHGVDGLVGVAALGLGLRIRDVHRENRDHSWTWLASLAGAIASNDARFLRVLACGGIGAAFVRLSALAASVGQRLVLRLSVVLERGA